MRREIWKNPTGNFFQKIYMISMQDIALTIPVHYPKGLLLISMET